MNIKIEKVDINNSEVMDFLVEENLKLYLELKPKKSALMMTEEYRGYIMKAFKEQFLNDITEKSTIYAAFLDSLVIGCGFMDGTGYLNSLFVKEEYRNQLIGTRLLEKLIEECSNFEIIRVDSSIEAVSLYERFSFCKTGVSTSRIVSMELERSHHGK